MRSKTPRTCMHGGAFALEGSGDDRLSRQRHYHGPGGLNGRVRNGNGCDPAGMVAGKPAGGLSGHAGRDSAVAGHKHKPFTPHRKSWHVRKNQNQPSVIWHLPSGICHLPVVIRIESVRPPDRSGRRSCSGTTAESRSGWSSCLAVRTGRLRRSPAVHARPIDLVVFQEPTHFCWKPNLGGGFALRCLQRLSCPDLATRRCR